MYLPSPLLGYKQFLLNEDVWRILKVTPKAIETGIFYATLAQGIERQMYYNLLCSGLLRLSFYSFVVKIC
jgi:hypothetical protein